MLVFSAVALVAAFTLTLEKIEKLQNPNAVLSCSINLVLNCSTVMETPQSHVFGFPNMLIGMMAYPVLICVAVAGIGLAKFSRRFMIAANVGILLGALFSYWLFFTSVYVIQVLCPWCLAVTFSTTLILASFTHITLRSNTFKLSKVRDVKVQAFLAAGYDKLIIFAWLVLLVALVFSKFGSALFA
jgi:uncharacterized membrane protein